MTQLYVGVKIVEAWPQEKDGNPGYALKYRDGYTSWSPKAEFEQAYLAVGLDRAKAEAICDDARQTIISCRDLLGATPLED